MLLFVTACANPYKHFSGTPANLGQSVLKYKPKLDRDVYHCVIDGRFLFKKFHLSGVLLIKQMENKHTRAVFSNEMGFSFFDFEWDEKDSFSVNQIIPQLDKPAVIKTLKKDFNVLMMKGLDTSAEYYERHKSMYTYRFPLEKGDVYYATFEKLTSIDIVGKTVVTTISLKSGKQNSLADTILIDHHKAHFTIDLTKIDNNASE